MIRIINTSKDKEISIFLKVTSVQYQRVPELLVAQETVNLNQSNRYILSLGNDWKCFRLTEFLRKKMSEMSFEKAEKLVELIETNVNIRKHLEKMVRKIFNEEK